MIKYVTFNSVDDFGNHVTPIEGASGLSKVASQNYSSEIASVISSMVKKPDMYYVVINALGSFEVWGVNGNGDAFPAEGLSHKSLRTDVGTINDYGYKTFEYYAKFFKHHNNTPTSPSYGEVLFAHWNEKMHRVELVVGIDRTSGADVIEAFETGKNIAVSMGCKVKHDRCNICGNLAPTRDQYCKHAKGYLGKIIDADIAALWSRELGKEIKPGTKVFVYNDKPRFFDISRVYVGADRTAHILGKAASNNGDTISSTEIADAMGWTDEKFDKIASVEKQSEIEKHIGALGPDDIDGKSAYLDKAKMIEKAIAEKMRNIVSNEPEIDSSILNNISERFPLKNILSSMLFSGIMPKPREFQRIVLVRAGHKNLADELDRNNALFNTGNISNPVDVGLSSSNAIGSISGAMSGCSCDRSFAPGSIAPRVLGVVVIKQASLKPVMVDLPFISDLYSGFISKAASLSSADLNNPLFYGISAITPAIMSRILTILNGVGKKEVSGIPASAYEDILQDTNFSGMLQFSANDKTASMVIDNVVAPLAYIKTASEEHVKTKYCSSFGESNSKLSIMLRNANKDSNNMLYSL